MAIHCRLSTVLGERRLKQLDVVRATGLAKATVGALYHDKVKKVDYDVVNKLCAFLGVDVGDLFRYVPDEADGPRDGQEATRPKKQVK